MKKTKTIGLISAAAIAMALTIAFSGVALASHPVPPTDQTETLDITTSVTCSGSVVESQRLSLEIDSINLTNNLPLRAGEKYGKIGYNEKMIGSNGTTDFEKTFNVNTNTTSNLHVDKQIGYTQGELGSLSHEEQLGMKVVAAGKPKSTTTGKKGCPPYDNTTRKLEEWKWCICPFTQWGATKTTTPAVPGSCEEVNTYSKIVMTKTDGQVETTTDVGITEAPVNLNYKITAKGTGLVIAGVGVYVEDGRGYGTLGSKMAYKEKTIGYGKSVNFTKDIGYKSVYSP